MRLLLGGHGLAPMTVHIGNMLPSWFKLWCPQRPPDPVIFAETQHACCVDIDHGAYALQLT
jgi:hypothetical protein